MSLPRFLRVACASVFLGVACGDEAVLDPAAPSPADGSDAGPVASASPDAAPPTGGGEGTPICPVGAAPDASTVPTTRGLVAGEADGSGLVFRGIRYAVAPTGDKRWKAPEPPACWADVVPAKAFGSACPQTLSGVFHGDEDCLFLNVWTPAVPSASTKKRPVLFWIHGGADISGSADSFTPTLGKGVYAGRKLAEAEDVIVVSANYRLGALGWLAPPALGDAAHGGASGNYGLLDQIAALRWVKDNIAAFGGDPSKVMVFGESAGAIDTCALIASPLAAGLFSSALMESGSCEDPTRAYREEKAPRSRRRSAARRETSPRASAASPQEPSPPTPAPRSCRTSRSTSRTRWRWPSVRRWTGGSSPSRP